MKDLDLSASQWTCLHCDAAIEFSTDPTRVYRHLAFECVLMDEAKALEHAGAYTMILSFSPIRRAMVAHLIKHPEDEDETFAPPASVVIN